MNTSKRLLVSLALVGVLIALFVPALPCQSVPPVRVLFVGNSYTYFNNLPEMFRELAAAVGQHVETRMVAPGGWRLQDHWEKGAARQALTGARWDYVVLQDQSTLGVTYYLEGKTRVGGDEVFRPYADKWVAEVKKARARPVFYLTWARQATPDDQAALTYAYMSAAKQGGALVVPVGLAWSRVRTEHPEIGLFAGDGSHPSPAGTYLAACTFLATLLERSPEGLPRTVEGQSVNLETGQVEAGKVAVLADLPAAHAAVLQSAAWATWQALKAKGGYLDVQRVPPPTLAPLPPPAAASPSELEGRWSGVLLFHPSGPATIVLTLRHVGGSWSGHLDVTYASKDVPAESLDLVGLAIANGEVRFADPISAATAKLRIDFRGVVVGTDELRGVAEASASDPNSALRLVGSWTVRRQR